MSIKQNICKKESMLSKEIKKSNETYTNIKSVEDIQKTLNNDTNFPPSNFIPSTPPEHDFIYGCLYKNDIININAYANYSIND